MSFATQPSAELLQSTLQRFCAAGFESVHVASVHGRQPSTASGSDTLAALE